MTSKRVACRTLGELKKFLNGVDWPDDTRVDPDTCVPFIEKVVEFRLSDKEEYVELTFGEEDCVDEEAEE